jgi:hypothetical protein
MKSVQDDQPGAVYEHTVHSALIVARSFAVSAVAGYDPARQARDEQRLTYRHNTANERRTHVNGDS